MVVSNLVFDLFLYGGLLVALWLDSAVPALHGIATVIMVSAATYLAAEDGAVVFTRRKLWSQDSLATAVSISIALFMYYWYRNDADVIAVVLHIGLMMASLMILISVVAAGGAVVHARNAKPVAGLILTAAFAVALGLLSGLLILALTSVTPLGFKAGLVVAGGVVWKVRELAVPPLAQDKLAPPRDEHAPSPWVNARPLADAAVAAVAQAIPGQAAPARIVVPRHGALLDRFLPILILCLVAVVALRGSSGITVP